MYQLRIIQQVLVEGFVRFDPGVCRCMVIYCTESAGSAAFVYSVVSLIECQYSTTHRA